MESIILIVGIIFILWILKKIFTSSDKTWKQAKKFGLKKTNSSSENCSKCIKGNLTITTIKGKSSTNGVYCSKKDIEVSENMVCSEFENTPVYNSGKYSHFGS